MIRVVHKIDKLKSSSVRIVEPKLICLDLVSIIELNRLSIILFLRIISACVSIFFPKSLQFFQLAVSRFTYYFCVISDFPYFFLWGRVVVVEGEEVRLRYDKSFYFVGVNFQLKFLYEHIHFLFHSTNLQF